MVKHLPTMWDIWVQSLGWEDLLEKEMATHSGTLAWKIPWTEKPGRLQSMGQQSRTRLSDFTFTFTPEAFLVPTDRRSQDFLASISTRANSYNIYTYACMLSHFSHVQLFATLWTVAHQSPLSMGFSRQEYWSGLPCPPPGDLPNPGIELVSPMSPALTDRFFTTSTTWEAHLYL